MLYQTQLFLPYILQHDLEESDTSAALSISHHFSHLSYFPHAQEILLHHVLDEEVENERNDKDTEGGTSQRRLLLPTVLSFLQSANPRGVYLDILVQCIRKTELRSWRTLFAHLPPPEELFEQALKLKSLKTAAGYLLVLQALDDDEDGDDHAIEDSAVRLLRLATHKGDWELCGELARFLIALDRSGDMLRRAVVRLGLRNPNNGGNLSPAASSTGSRQFQGSTLHLPSPSPGSLSPRSTGNRSRDE